MWSQAPAASAASAIASKASNEPVFTSPAFAQTIAGPSSPASASRSASGRIRPWSSAGIRSIEPVPRPMKRSARGNVECAFSPAKTRIGGAPVRPFSSTSQPTSASTWLRAAAIAVACAIWRAGDERERPRAREAEQVGEPVAGDLLDDRRRGAGDVEARVLVPGRGQPVGGERRRDGAADHEAEVAPARDRDRRLAADRGEVGDDLARDRSGRRAPGRRAGRAARRRRPRERRAGRAGDSRKSAARSAVSWSSSRMTETLPAAELAERGSRGDRLGVDAQLDQRGPACGERRLERRREVLGPLDERRVRAERLRVGDEVGVDEVGRRRRGRTDAPGACGSSRASRC